MTGTTEFKMGRDECRWEWNRCKICGAYHKNKTYTAKEMMYGTKEEFDYFICGDCGCMQIVQIPDDLGKYYKDNYYSMQERQEYEFEGDAIYTKDRILDVGCGTGEYLLELANKGHGNLYGCDPFIENDIYYACELKVCITKKPENPTVLLTLPAIPELSALCIIRAFALISGKNVSGNSASVLPQKPFPWRVSSGNGAAWN